MGARNYQPTLRRLLHQLDVFIGHYQTLIEGGLTAPQAAYFATFLTALNQLITSLGNPGGV